MVCRGFQESPQLLTLRQSLLLSAERIVYTSQVAFPRSVLSSYLATPKKRQLVLTDFPRLIEVKEEGKEMKIKHEMVLGPSRGSVLGAVKVEEKGSKGFVVHAVSLACSWGITMLMKRPIRCAPT